MENKYYIYLHIKLDSGEPFYVGKGNGNRAYCKYRRSNLWKNIVNKHNYDIIFLEEELTNSKALEREIYWINRIGRRDLDLGPLANLTNGGDGGNTRNGKLDTAETKFKKSEAAKKRIYTEEDCKKMGRKKGSIPPNKGKKGLQVAWNKGKTGDQSHVKGKQNYCKKLINEKGIIFNSVKEAALEYKIDVSALYRMINKKLPTKNITDLNYLNK